MASVLSRVQVSIYRNDTREVLADWLIAKKKSAQPSVKHRTGGNHGGPSREQKMFAIAYIRTQDERFFYEYM